MQKQISVFLVAIFMAVSFSACFVTRTTVGNGPKGKEESEVYSKSRRVYLFGGLVPLGLAQPQTPQHGNFQVKSSNNVTDAIITWLTFGILSTRTTKILVKPGEK